MIYMSLYGFLPVFLLCQSWGTCIPRPPGFAPMQKTTDAGCFSQDVCFVTNLKPLVRLAAHQQHISHIHRAYDYLGPFGVLWVHMA